MKSLLIALSVLGFTSFAQAEMKCKATTGKYAMNLACPDGRQGVVDEYLPTDKIINASYIIKFKDSKKFPPVAKTFTGDQLKDLIKSTYQKKGAYPQAEKLVPILNGNSTKYKVSDIDKVEPVEVIIDPSMKIYKAGLVSKGNVVQKQPNGQFKNVPAEESRPTQVVPQQRKGTGKVRAQQ